MQADILDLEKLNMKFDMIECSGVLHHMKEPLAGWRVLVNCLKTGGLMKIGLYSERARTDIVDIHKEIDQSNIGQSTAAMKAFRNELINSSLAHHKKVSSFPDFYSLSMFRDLLFHCLLYTSPSPRDGLLSRMPSSA